MLVGPISGSAAIPLSVEGSSDCSWSPPGPGVGADRQCFIKQAHRNIGLDGFEPRCN